MRRLWRRTIELGRLHGAFWTVWIILLLSLRRLFKAHALICLGKLASPRQPQTARLLGPSEIELARQDPVLDLPADFVSSDRCFGIVRQGYVVSYVWLADAGPTPVLPGAAVVFPNGSLYVYKAFTHPQHRGRRLLSDCLAAVDSVAASHQLRTLIEPHNRSSLRGFRREGFKAHGLLVIRDGTASVLRLFGCWRCQHPCSWTADTGRHYQS